MNSMTPGRQSRLLPTAAALSALAVITFSSAALGQQAGQKPGQKPADKAANSDWDIRLGGGGLVRPEYEGSDEYKVSALPVLMVNYRDMVFLHGTTLGANALTLQGPNPGDKLQVGPLVRYRFGRDQDDSDDLRGMGDIDGAVELGGFISYSTGPWSAGLTLFRDVSDAHDGMTAELSAGHRMQLGPKLMLRSEISTTWADDNYMQAYYGVTGVQSARSGMRQYQAESGFQDAGITFDLDYLLTENWSITGRVGYKRMLGDAADSPLVADLGSEDQFSTGLYITYKF
ncbi:MipA/OmpV family protein [Oceanibaculum sp.]|uniref:MipA/OmpV family protein n=1 Tax=Oceanibaculum sp. TaxID=1903597 RepID=UPI00258AE710|nr:MipA/OmpV family protein [Oceanibaculum sp.]MCH2393059.1 MipA/OmpV family protein [Oceanibaculum sp.]